MFEDYKKYKKILVSGPQRSGTRLAAQAIAHDLGYKYIDEMEFGIDNVRKFLEIYDKKENVVIQCPGMSFLLWVFDDLGTAIIFMRREISKIIESQARINWTQRYQPYELMKYGQANNRLISDVKYNAWGVQKLFIKKADKIDLKYGDLKQHPFWKTERKNFVWNQIK